jgi:hypothetical protein
MRVLLRARRCRYFVNDMAGKRAPSRHDRGAGGRCLDDARASKHLGRPLTAAARY